MSSFYTKLSNKIFNSADFSAASGILFGAYVKKTADEEYSIERDVVKNLTTSLQYFYQSDDELMKKEGAELLSMLLYVCGDETPELVAIADHVFNEAGDFPNITLLQNKFSNINFKVSVFDEARRDLRKTLNTVDEIDHPLTDYQRSLWEDLTNGEDVITSAPTSTGKTHVILQYLIDEVASSPGAFTAIVVPTRALISEVASKIYDIVKSISCENDIEICTVPKEGVFKDKTFFVMTQERLFEILQTGLLSFDYLFVDEAHNISDKSRGVLLHMTLQKLLEGSNPQIIISMPSSKYLNAFNSVFENTEFSTKTTKHSPVAKILINTKLQGRNILLSRRNDEFPVTIKKNYTGDKLSQMVYRLGVGESNIIYRNKTNYCEDVARDIATLIMEEKNSPRLAEAADYVTRFLHPEFSLADNLKKGVAFHYGPLPGVVRRMVETLVREKEVDFIVCTSTLAEGVNLPAKNLFLQNPIQLIPYKTSERIENVRLDNITGRAGRMLEHFAGNIFLVDPEEWAYNDYFDSDDEEADKIPTYYQILNEDLDGVIKALDGEYDHSEDDQYTYYTIANKLLRELESGAITTTFSARELTLQDIEKDALLSKVQSAYDSLRVDSFTLEANPTVGYLQQNTLYNFLIEQDDLSQWALPHPRSQSLYAQLEKICSELNQFGIFLPSASSVAFACVIAKKWIQGDPLRLIITEQIARHQDRKCNKNVRDVIKTINTDIRFKMASALRCYQLLLANAAKSKEVEVVSVKLHAFIEVGGCEKRLIQLVSLGLSRETAVEVHGLLGDGIEVSSFEALRQLYEQGQLAEIHSITKKEIEKMLL
ncbi:DEAD/DEAH box helicase [Maridesulfovibrio frigidus]|uniref:DEAD/DEAH box helicase n=1 Tax=Maridesulfovibrio frigidus TaxID=340956 RepID=UPI0004E0AF86|nr:DEAD/DEAH box helicase [Maridesulfovibrio frigidus]